MFLTKYNKDGAKQWTKLMGAGGADYGNDVSVDGNGNVYVTGAIESDLYNNNDWDFDNIFLVKYNTDGVKLWTKELSTSGNDSGQGVSVDDNGNVYVSGITGQSVNGFTHGGLDGNTNAGGADMFLTKYDTKWQQAVDQTTGHGQQRLRPGRGGRWQRQRLCHWGHRRRTRRQHQRGGPGHVSDQV